MVTHIYEYTFNWCVINSSISHVVGLGTQPDGVYLHGTCSVLIKLCVVNIQNLFHATGEHNNNITFLNL